MIRIQLSGVVRCSYKFLWIAFLDNNYYEMRISFYFLLLQEIAINGNSIGYSILALTGSRFSYYLLGMLVLANCYYWLAKSKNIFKFYLSQIPIVAFASYLKDINKNRSKCYRPRQPTLSINRILLKPNTYFILNN